MNLIAINTIHRAKEPGKEPTHAGARRIPPVTEIIPAGSKFSVSQAEAEDLVRVGAAKLDESAPAKEEAKAPAKEEPTKAKEEAKAPAKEEAKAPTKAKAKTKAKDEDDDEDMI